MRRALFLSMLLVSFSVGVVAQSQPDSKAKAKAPAATTSASPADVQAVRASFAKLPLSFEQNTGQADARVKFLSRAANYNLFLTADEAVLALRSGNANSACTNLPARKNLNCVNGKTPVGSKDSVQSAVLWMKMLGGNASAQISGTDPLPGKINYYVGNDPSKWRTGVRQFGRVSYRDIYPGVDLTYYGNERQLESDFVVAPGANPRAIEFEVRGARETRLDAQGNLVLGTDAGNVQLLRPVIYQTIKGVRHDVSGRYALRGKDRVGFEIAKYDTHSTLVIDPVLVYSTYLGGSNLSSGDGALAIAVQNGRAFVTGSGTSSDFPGSDLAGPPVETLSDFAFVTELDSTGSSTTGTGPGSLVYSTILSGSETGDYSTSSNAIGLDSSGNAYIAGTTGSSNFPMVNPFQATFGGAAESGFVAGLTTTGTLIYSTYLGGRNGADETVFHGLFADAAGDAYVVGNTTSANFPTINSYQSTLNVAYSNEDYTNVVVSKLNPQGQPIYSTYLNGTNSDDVGTAIVADGSGNAYVTGETLSTGFPVQTSPAPFQPALAGTSYNAFVTKLNFNTTTSVLSIAGGTYLGGVGSTEGLGIALDTASPPNIYVTGSTTASGTGTSAFPIVNPITGPGTYSGGTNAGGTDAFLTKISGNFTTVTYSTFLGGSGTDIAYGIALDGATPPNVFVTGSTNSSNFPLVGSLQATLGSATATNAFVAEVNGAGSALTYSTYLGGFTGDVSYGIALDSSDDAYIAGKTTSANFPLVSGGAGGTNPFQGQLGSTAGNAFIAKISPAAQPAALTFFPPSYNFHNVGIGGATGFATEMVTLTNNTASSVTVNSFTMGGTDPGDFTIQSASAPCSTTAAFALAAAPAANSSCTLVIRFTPMDQDTRTATLSINSAPSSSSVLNLTGSGGVPQLSLSTTSLTFFPNPDPLNVEAESSVTVTNSGGGVLQIGGAQIQLPSGGGTTPFSVTNSCAGTSINPGNSCSIELAFVPTTGGTATGTLLINSNTAGSPNSVSLTGVGVQEVLVSPTSLELGPQVVGSTSMNNENEFIVENGSGETITLTVTPGTSASQGDFHVNTSVGLNICATGLSLAPGGECEMIIYFQPTAASATDGRTGSYTIAWTGTAVTGVVPSSQTVNLMGTGITGVSLYTYSITAPNEYVGITEGSSGLEYLYNGTNSPINVTTTLSGNNPGDFGVTLDPSCAPGGVVPANTYCSVALSFTPSALGLRSVTATFEYTGDNGEPLVLTGSGTGIPGPVIVTPGSHSFGSEIINTTTPETKFLVRNVATAPLTISSITSPGNTDFKFSSDTTCPTGGGTVLAGGSCFIGVTFSPSGTSAESTSFVITDSYGSTGGVDSASPHTVTLTGTGEPAAITVSVSSGGQNLLDFGNVALNPTTLPQAQIYLTNAGNSSTTITWPVPPNTTAAPGLMTTGTAFALGTGTNLTTCTQSKVVLPQGASCFIGVTFDPTTAGEQTNSVTFSDSVGGPHTVNIQGNGVAQGKLSLSTTTTLSDVELTFNQLVSSTGSAQTATVANLGGAPLTITSLPLFGTNASTSFTVLPSSTCTVGTVLPSGATGNTCLLNITFTAPATAGNTFGELEVEASIGNNQTSDVIVELNGNALAGGLSLSPAGPINFGAVAVGTTSYGNDTEYTVTNNNPTSVVFGTMQAPNTAYAITYDTCSTQTIASASSCYFELTFTPANATTNYNGNLTLPYTGATGSPFTVALQGSGSTAVVANPNPLSFTYSGDEIVLTVTNGSPSASATITGISALTGANPSAFSFPYNGCTNGTVLTTSGGQCSIYVEFQSSAVGNLSAQFTVSYTVGGAAQTPIAVMLNATLPAAIVTVSPPSLTFSPQLVNTQSPTQYVTLTNSASATEALDVTNVQIMSTGTATPASNFAALSTAANYICDYVQAGQSCTIPIAFTPSQTSATNGLTATLIITDNSTTSPHMIPLTGTGMAGGLTANTTGLTFPQTTVGSTYTLALQLTNSGAAVTFSGVTYTGPYSSGTGPNACSGTIPAVTGSCIVYIQFAPNGGTTSGTAIVHYNSTSSLASIALTGSQLNPEVNASPISLTFGAQAVGTASAAQTVTLNNPTSSSVSVTGTPGITGTNAGDFTFGTDSCIGATLPATTGSCVVIVIFDPGPTGGTSRSATLSITASDANSPHTVTLSGTAIQPVTSLGATTMAFGNLDLGLTSGQQTVTLSNIGNATLNLSSVVLGGTNVADFALATPASGTDCRTVTTLAANASCTVAATFTPLTTGSLSATITFTDNATPATQVITLTGNGTQPGVNLLPTTVPFGNQPLNTTSAQSTSILTNSGTGPLTITSVTLAGTNLGDFALVTPTSGSDCRTIGTVAASGTCTIAATFTPTATGSRSATVSVADNASGSPQTVTLTGTGTAPVASVPSSLSFGNELVSVPSTAQTVTLTNTGTSNLTIAGVAINPTSTNASDFAIVSGAGTTCVANATVGFTAPNNTCTVSVTFTPATAGSLGPAVLNITDNSNEVTGSVQSVNLTGTGQTPPTATLSTTSVQFPSQLVGTTGTATVVTITNNGNATLAIASIALDVSGNPSDFVLSAGATNPCPLTGGNVSGGASCTFNVAFKPTTTGPWTATVDITDNGNPTGTAGTKQTVALSGTGIAPLAQVASMLAFGNQPINQTSTMPLTLTNTGTGPLTLAATNAVAITTGTNSTLFGIASTSTCTNNLVIAANGTCTINVTFTPTTVGTYGPVILVITDNSGAVTGSTQSVSLSGSGVTAAVNFAPSPVNFTPSQNVGTTSANTTVTVTNSGGLAVQLAATGAVAITGTNASDFAIVTTGTTCVNSFNLAASTGTCNVILTFTPGGTGPRTATLTVTDNANPTTQTVTLNGTGVAPVASVPSSLSFGNELVSVASAAQTVTLTNTGTSNLTIASVAINPTSTNASDFAIISGAGTTCVANATVGFTAPNNTCTVAVTFTPGAAGTRGPAVLNITDNSNEVTGSVQSVNLTGTGQTPPTATLSTTSVQFPSQLVGTTSTATVVTITNNGNATLAIASIALDASGNPTDFVLSAGTTNPCPLTGGNVTGGSSCTFNVAFKPTGTGPWSATVDITDNGNPTGTAGTKQTVALSGTGIEPLAQVASMLAFGNQPINQTSTMPLTLTNTGTGPLTLAATNAVAITTGTNSTLFGIASTSTCTNNLVIAANGTCTINVTFTPTTVGTYGPVTLVITDNSGAVTGSTQSVTLTATAVTSTVNFNPSTVGFGNQLINTPSAQSTSTLTNSGTSTLTISSVTLTGTNPGDFALVTPASGSDCRTIGTVASGGTCTVAVTFTPTATGSRGATVSVADNAVGSPHTLALTGTGTAPVVALSTTAVTFPNQIEQTTSSTPQTITLTNTGTANLTIGTVVLGGTNPGDFAIVTGTGTTCVANATVGFTAPNNTCTVAVTFTPATANPFSATLTFTDNASPTTQAATLSGTGVTPPTATPTPTSLTFTSQPTTTTSAAQTITLANNGGAPLSITSINIAGTNPGDFAFASPATTCPTGTTGGQVAAGSNCVLSITFDPTATGTRTANISIVVTGITNPAPITLTGTGTAPDVAIAKSHTGNFEVGTNGSYNITLTNNGTAATQHPITVTDTLPAGLTFVSAAPASWSCSAGAQNAQIVTCTNPGPINTGVGNASTITLTVTPSLTAFTNSPVTNTATVSDTGDSGTTDKSATDQPTVITAPDVTISNTNTADFVVGSTGVYTIKLTNNGTGPTNGNITVTDTLPTGLTLVSSAGTGWTCVPGAQNAQLVTCAYTGASLAAAGGSNTFMMTVSVAPNAITSSTSAGFVATNSVTVSDPNDSKTTDKSATDATNIDNTVPTQSAFSPSLGLIAGATSPQTITLTGTGFNSSTLVTIGSNPALTGTPNAAGTSLTITVPVAYLANAGNQTITVTNPKNPTTNNGGGAALTTQTFPVVSFSLALQTGTPNPVPLVAGTPVMFQVNVPISPTGAALPASVTIACTVPAALTGATCTPGTTTIAQGSTTASTMITLTAVPGGSSRVPPSSGGPGPLTVHLMWLAAMVLAAMWGMFLLSRQQALQARRTPVYLTLFLLAIGAATLVGCTTSPMGPTPTPTGASMVTVTATTADGASSSIQVPINVTN